MKIIIAKTAGFCMGVKRAVELAIEHAQGEEKTLYTMGPLIHNQQTIDMLQDHGVDMLKNEKLPEDSSRIIIRAHGVPPQTLTEISDHGHDIIDGTCPKVTAVHKVIKKYREQGFTIVITGDEGHAEVIGLMGHAGDAGYLIQTPQDIDKLPSSDKFCIVSQTTFNSITFEDIATKLSDQFPRSELVIKKTICSATDKRQIETRELADQVDAMIVVGGKHSANTLRLANIAREYTKVQHVETEQEINWQDLETCETIGITAGASTPNWMIKRVVDHIYSFSNARKKSLKNLFFRTLDILAHLNFFVAVGAAIMTYTSSLLQGHSISLTAQLLVFLYFMSMHLWNGIANMESTRHLGIHRYQFYQKHKKVIFSFTVFCILTLLIISFTYNHTIFILMLFATLAGTFYHLTLIPKTFKKLFKYRNLKDIPTSRDFFTALAWAVLVTFIPHAIQNEFVINAASSSFFVAMFFMAYYRTLIFDLRDIEGDRIFGRETLVSIIGERQTKKLMQAGLWICFAGLVLFALISFIPGSLFSNTNPVVFLFQIPVLIYLWLFMKYNHRFKPSHYAWFNILADAQFFIAGLGAWMAKIVIV
jgi:(E)-4-hydroxy-3-methyl-but-2-enyl pyrophosphate reductase